MMNTYTAVRDRLLQLCGQKNMSAVPPSTVKNILYGKSTNPGIVTIKMLCDGLGISLVDFFDTPTFRSLEQEIQ